MLAVIRKTQDTYVACFERHLKHSVEDTWAMLTENDKLRQWFSELEVDDLREGGGIKFNMPDGTFKELKIIEFKLHSVLEYTWGGEDRVRFELYPEASGCRLSLIEKMNTITDHTPKDLTGWHVCLDVIQALLENRTVESRKKEWEKRYAEYSLLIEGLPNN
ncbi:SRPBCC family protein [Paenibacillus sp. SN-8-1]|uniref:SRPBCC family protein n=1 Tax=Paenibacillus sp. SN-8-1 TaxID=3435409 RepID=UPI003D9A5ACB